jgi:hypothetical protein
MMLVLMHARCGAPAGTHQRPVVEATHVCTISYGTQCLQAVKQIIADRQQMWQW